MNSLTYHRGIADARPDVGVIFVDAHADLNIPATSPSGNMHGMCMGFTVEEVKRKIKCVSA